MLKWLDSTRLVLPFNKDVRPRPAIVLLGCSAGRLVYSPASLGCSVDLLVGSPTSLGCSTVFVRLSELVGLGSHHREAFWTFTPSRLEDGAAG
jgi:hypothetical protein